MMKFSAVSYSSSLFIFLSAVTICLSSCASDQNSSRGGAGFTMNLHHRDSPSSPFHDSSLTQTDLIRAAITRSKARAAHIHSIVTQSSTEAKVYPIPGGGEYLMSFGIGTPAVQVMAVLDTGSQMTWTQCLPCTICFNQKLPVFKPQKSTTYRNYSCGGGGSSSSSDDGCPPIGLSRLPCDRKDKTCPYLVAYSLRSYSKGVFAKDTMTLDTTDGTVVRIPNYTFGCAHETSSDFPLESSGLIGFSPGPLAFVKQLDSLINGKFAYCLLPTEDALRAGAASKIKFGTSALVSGPGVVKTPLVAVKEGYYAVTLLGFTVGNQKLDYKGIPSLIPDGKMIIESGSALTILPETFYNMFEKAVASQTKGSRVPPDFSQEPMLCYRDDTSFKPPRITVHFQGADVELETKNTFLKVDRGICLAFAPFQDMTIYGNVAQINFQVAYDVVRGTLAFKRSDCAS